MEPTAVPALSPHDTVEERTNTDLAAPAASDAELVALINQGDDSAFEALYRRYREWVIQLAYRWTGDREAALDVLQETFIYFSRKFPGFKLTSRLQTFLYPAVKNLSIAARRKRERYEPAGTAEEVSELAVMAEEPDCANGNLTAVLILLPEEQREVLLLRFVDGLSLAEIAEAMGIPLGTVKSRLHNSLQTLRSDPRTKKLFDA